MLEKTKGQRGGERLSGEKGEPEAVLKVHPALSSHFFCSSFIVLLHRCSPSPMLLFCSSEVELEITDESAVPEPE